MIATLLALLAILFWSPLVTAFVLKVFPEFTAKLLLQGLEHRSEVRLAKIKDELARETSLQVERAKAELQASYSTLKTSVDVVATGQSGMRAEVISAVSRLWGVILELRAEFSAAVNFDLIFKQDEIGAAIDGSGNTRILAMIERYRNGQELSERSLPFLRHEANAPRLFCGDRLWLLFYVTRAVYIRLAWLMNNSFVHRRYHDWRKDRQILSLLAGALPDEVIKLARDSREHGLLSAMTRLETDFLHEATRVMSGSKAISDSLSDMQAVMLLEAKRTVEAHTVTLNEAPLPNTPRA